MIDNPVLRRELMLRFRLRQTPLGVRIFVGAAIVLLVGWIYWLIIVKWVLSDPSPSTGITAWWVLMSVQFTLVCLIAPSVTANAITQEKEQQTWEMLIFTRLRPAEIILGKLLARTLLLCCLLALFVPVAVVSYMRAAMLASSMAGDHLSAGQFVLTYLVLLVCIAFFATFGLYMSWLMRRTLYAIMLSYTFVIGGLTIGTFMVTAALSALFTDPGFLDRCPIMWLNPVMLIVEAINPSMTPYTTSYLVFGLTAYTILTLLILWRMSVGFRRFAHQP